MTKAPCQARDECDPLSASNPSLVTAGLPARSTMKSPCIAASPTAPSPYHDHGTNNPSQDCLKSQSTLESNAHVQLSRKDINDVLHALQTLGRFVKEDVHGTHHRHPRCSFPSDGKLDHRHPSKQTYLYPVDNAQQDPHERRNLTSYPSYCSNALLYASDCRSSRRAREICHYSRQRQSTRKIPSQDQQSIKKNPSSSSSLPLSACALDEVARIHQERPISTLQILPQRARTLEILRNNHRSGALSTDSLQTKPTLLTRCHSRRTQLRERKNDVATQWSIQMDASKHVQRSDALIDPIRQEQNASNTESVAVPRIDSSTTPHTIESHSDVEQSCARSGVMVNEHGLTKSETERFLTTLNVPTCKCSRTERALLDEKVTCISLDDCSTVSSSSLSSARKRKQRAAIKVSAQQARGRSSRFNRSSKPFCPGRHTQLQHRRIIDPTEEESSFDFLDMDVTFSNVHERLFADTITTSSEKFA